MQAGGLKSNIGIEIVATGIDGYSTDMIRAYEEIAELIAAGGGPEAVVDFQASATTRERVAELIEREKAGALKDDEQSELDQYLQLEHVMRLAKARAQARLDDE